MAIISTISSGTMTQTGNAVTDIQRSIGDSAREQSTGLGIFWDTAPADMAVWGTMEINYLETTQYIANMLRGQQILEVIIPGLQGVKDALLDALTAAEAVASDLLSATEISIQNTAYLKAIEKADNVVKGTTFVGTTVLKGGVASGQQLEIERVASTSGLGTTTEVNTLAGTATPYGAVYGNVDGIDVIDAGGGSAGLGFQVSMTIGGVVYQTTQPTLPADSGTFELISTFDGVSKIVVDYDVSTAGITDADAFKNALEDIFSGSTWAPANYALNSETFTDNDVEYSYVSVDLGGSSVSGPVAFSLNRVNKTIYMQTASGEVHSVILPASGFEGNAFTGDVFLSGIKFTFNDFDITETNFTSQDIDASSNNINEDSMVFVVSKTGGYTKTVTAGEASITMSLGDQTMATRGLEGTTITDAATAALHVISIKSVLEDLDKLMGNLGATMISFRSSGEGLKKQNDSLAGVISSVKDANIVEVIQETVSLILRQEFAAQTFSSVTEHQRTLINTLARVQ